MTRALLGRSYCPSYALRRDDAAANPLAQRVSRNVQNIHYLGGLQEFCAAAKVGDERIIWSGSGHEESYYPPHRRDF